MLVSVLVYHVALALSRQRLTRGSGYSQGLGPSTAVLQQELGNREEASAPVPSPYHTSQSSFPSFISLHKERCYSDHTHEDTEDQRGNDHGQPVGDKAGGTRIGPRGGAGRREHKMAQSTEQQCHLPSLWTGSRRGCSRAEPSFHSTPLGPWSMGLTPYSYLEPETQGQSWRVSAHS